MTQAEEKLEALIQKAIDGGWNDYGSLESLELIKTTANTATLKGWIEFVDDEGNTDELTSEIDFNYKELIFSHDFAKALFGETELDLYYNRQLVEAQFKLFSGTVFGEISTLPAFQVHIMLAVVSDDPIDYMYNAVFGENHGA